MQIVKLYNVLNKIIDVTLHCTYTETTGLLYIIL